MKLGGILLAFFFCFIVAAVEVDPITLTTVYKYESNGKRDRSEFSSLVLFTKDNGNMDYVQVRVFDSRGREKRGKRKNITANDLRGDGETIKSQMGVDVITLRSNNVSEPYGGDIIVDYLEEWGGLFGSNTRNQFEIQLERNQDDWRVVHDGTPFDQMHIYERKKGKGIDPNRFRFTQSRRMRESSDR